MKWIFNFKPLNLKKVDCENIDVIEYIDNSWIANVYGNDYLIVKRNFKNNIKLDNLKLENANIELIPINTNNKTNLSTEFGAEDSIIIDMNGIDNFRFAKSVVFNDFTVRKIVKKMKLLNDYDYLRIGASGAQKNGSHPGGEVFEYSLINGKTLDGLSQNVSGYLPTNKSFSKSIPLYDEDKKTLREQRIVYSHTAWLRKVDKIDSRGIHFSVKAVNKEESLLDILNTAAEKFNLKCFSFQIYIKSTDDEGNTKIIGRVLKHKPNRAFKDIPDVVKISYEKTFVLQKSEIMYAVGTKYERYEPEWKEFTNGGRYERRGHLHATILKNKNNNKKHETFHLRDAFISPNTEVEIILNPVDTIFRIYPIHKENDIFICDASEKPINDVVKNIRLFEEE